MHHSNTRISCSQALGHIAGIVAAAVVYDQHFKIIEGRSGRDDCFNCSFEIARLVAGGDDNRDGAGAHGRTLTALRIQGPKPPASTLDLPRYKMFGELSTVLVRLIIWSVEDRCRRMG